MWFAGNPGIPWGLIMAETKAKTFLTVKRAARFLGVADNTMRHWDAVGGSPRPSPPEEQLPAVQEDRLERICKEIQATGTYPTGWQRPRRPR